MEEGHENILKGVNLFKVYYILCGIITLLCDT
jgi:hypothetical protein